MAFTIRAVLSVSFKAIDVNIIIRIPNLRGIFKMASDKSSVENLHRVNILKLRGDPHNKTRSSGSLAKDIINVRIKYEL